LQCVAVLVVKEEEEEEEEEGGRMSPAPLTCERDMAHYLRET